ncbi:MAG: hypothetical protein ACRDKG_04130, partial [Actinomycetota bacterium]
MRRILVIGIAAALLTGVLVATATASVEETTQAVDDSPMTVPDGKVGDEVRYARFWKSAKDHETRTASGTISAGAGDGSESASGKGSTSDEDWSQSSVEVFRIESAGKSIDRQARLHDVVLIRSNHTSEDYTGTSLAYVEVAARSVVRSDHKADFSEVGNVLAFSSFHMPGENVYFPHQGETYTLGQELEPAPETDYCGGSGVGVGWGGGMGLIVGRREIGFSAISFDCDDAGFEGPQVVSSKKWVAQRGT